MTANRTLLLIALLASASAWAALPPKYLAIPAFEKCLATQQQGTFQTWCQPARQPAACPAASWQQLRALKGQDKLPRCH